MANFLNTVKIIQHKKKEFQEIKYGLTNIIFETNILHAIATP